jgi:multidrug efflux pump subunit AcrB
MINPRFGSARKIRPGFPNWIPLGYARCSNSLHVSESLRGIPVGPLTFPPTIEFLSGITGQFFRQFALTIAASTIISAFNSLTPSPGLAATRQRCGRRPAAVGVRSDGRLTLGGPLGGGLSGAGQGAPFDGKRRPRRICGRPSSAETSRETQFWTRNRRANWKLTCHRVRMTGVLPL